MSCLPKQARQNMACLPKQARQKGGGRWGKIFLVWFVIEQFETLICAIAEDKVCDSCIVSSWVLLIFLLCLWWPNSNFLCCVITKLENLAVTFCYLWLTETLWLIPGGHSPPSPPPPPPPPATTPFKTLIALLPVTFPQLDPQLGVGWWKRLVLW